VAGAVVLLGEAAVAGDDVVAGELVLEFELGADSSAHPTAKANDMTAASTNAVRVISLVLELLICFSSFEQD